MDFLELLSSAFEALGLNKTRTALATLGIIIGIAAMITLLSLGQAGQKSVENQIQSLGSNLLTVIPGSFRPGDFRSAAGTATTLNLDDAKAISAKIMGVKNVSAELQRRSAVSAGKQSVNTSVVGVLPAYKTIRNVSLQSGDFISEPDNLSLAKVVVLGPTTANNLFGDNVNPVGQSVRINKISFRVISVTVAKGGSGFGGNQDDLALVPLATAQKQLFGVDYVGSVSVEVADAKQMDAVRDQIGYLLLARHKISDPANADFSIFSQQDVLSTVSQVTGTFTALLSGIAAISLLVGGIGIMNIMLVTVVERTREIGLRKALGATAKIVVMQFLVEAIILTIAGGLLGMFLGIILSFIIAKFINLPFILDIKSILLSLGVSGGIGVLFGWYPARKAAALSPIEALRYE
ncbi:ABC transporter permease [Candidatus Gottesmanbacteria bacterium]|nr:ABC transporter permease [Candidatus Gottesmanbacteria bacterium]